MQKGKLIVALAENADGSENAGDILLEIDTDSWQSIVVPVNISCGKVALFFKYSGEGMFDMLKFTLS